MQVVLLHAMASPSKPLRQTGGTSVAVIVGVGGLQNWPELIRALTSSLESNDKNSLEGSLDALYKVPPPSLVRSSQSCLLNKSSLQLLLDHVRVKSMAAGICLHLQGRTRALPPYWMLQLIMK